MEFKNYFLQLEAAVHAIDQLVRRLTAVSTNSPEILPNPTPLINEIRNNMQIAEIMYLGKSYAVQVVETLPFIVGERQAYDLSTAGNLRNEPSNGNMCVAILRPIPGSKKLTTVTFMFRRGENLGKFSQPFTPQALSVDKVRTYEQFKADYNDPQRQQVIQAAIKRGVPITAVS